MGTAGDGPSTSTDPPVSSPGVAFCTLLRGPQRRGDLGTEPAVQGTNVLAGQGQGQAGSPPPTRAVLTAPRGSRAGLRSALHKCVGRARSRSPAGGRELGCWGAPAASQVPMQQHPSVPALSGPRALQQHPADSWPRCPRTLCQAQGGVSDSAQGCKRAPPGEAKQGHVPTLGAGAQHGARSSAPGPSRGGDGCWGAATRTQGPPPARPHAWPARTAPARHNLLLRIPAVLSHLPWHGRAEQGCTKPSRAELSVSPNSPENTATLSHSPSPAGAWGTECQG